MHELPVTRSLLNSVLRHAEEANAQQVISLQLVLGEQSSIVGEAVQFYWDIISRGTIAEGAVLHFRHVPMQMICLSCNQLFYPDNTLPTCPHCDSTLVQAAGNGEFYLESIEMET